MGYCVEVALATLPRDRWGALGLYPPDPAGTEEARRVYRDYGSVWTAPVRLPAGGCRVLLNADHTRGMTIEASDANFQLLPEFSGTKSGRPGTESGLDCAVTWPAGTLGALGGKTIRLRINLRAEEAAPGRLYALCLRSD
jgi:hypothetical protein